jgi:ribosomal protein S18 acetylase RimI-like enzyme
MSDLMTAIDKLSAEQRGLLAQRLLRGSSGAAPAQGIAGSKETGPYPLSFAQQRLWFLDQLHPGNSAYNVYRAVRVRGPLDRGALGRALDEVVRRHEPLRTTVQLFGDAPAQVISPPAAVPLPVLDLRSVPEAERPGVVLRLADEEAHRPFDLSADLLLRAGLLHLGADEHVLLLTSHHLAADGWSVGILFSELSALYEAFAAGQPTPLPELSVRYANFAAWQRRTADGRALQPHLEYWRQQLAGLPAALNLPTDRPRPSVQTLANFCGARHYFQMPRPLLDALTALSRREGATLFMTLLTAFQTLLARYSGQDDIVVGSPTAGRNLPELERLVGCFSNTMVLRSRLVGDFPFRVFLGCVREMALAAFAHQEVPFEKLVAELQPRRVANRNPLFQVNFRLLTAPRPPLKLSGLDLTFLDVDNRMAKFDLAFELCARPEGLGGYVEYFADLFDPPTVRRMGADFEQLLGAIVDQPDTKLSALTRRDGAPGPTGTPTGRKGLRSVKRQAIGPLTGVRSQESGDRPAYSLRKATMKDCAFLYRLRALTLKPYVAEFPGWSDDQREAYYLDFDPSIHEIISVAGADAGAVAILRKDTEIRFVNLHLLPEYQNQGLGTAIFQEAIAEATARGVPVVLQGVLKTNPAIKLYERLGFVVTEESELRYVMTRPCHAPSTQPGKPSPPHGAQPAAPAGIRGIRRRGVQLSPGEQREGQP